MKPIGVDAGALYALIDESDRWHADCKAFLESNLRPLVVPITVLPEVCYFIGKNLGYKAEIEFLYFCQENELEIESLIPADFRRALDFMENTHAEIGFVDASLAAIAERLNITQLFTVDRRHFSLIRPRHCSAFTLFP